MLRRVLALGALGLLTCACASTAPSATAAPTPIFFPRHDVSGALPDALLSGTLVHDDGCLLVESDGLRWLPVWPADFEPGVINLHPVVLAPDRTLLVETGEGLILSGAGHEGAEQYAAVVDLIGQDVPEPCRVGRYWLVGSAERD